MSALELFLLTLKAAVFSVGGLSSLPLLRQEFVGSGAVSEGQVLESLVIGRLSTGPNGLYIISLAYFALGWVGVAAATAAVALPPLSLVALAALGRRWLLTPWAAGIVRGIGLTTSALVIATAVGLIAPDGALLSVPAWQLAITAVATVLVLRARFHPAFIVVAGAAIGIALAR